MKLRSVVQSIFAVVFVLVVLGYWIGHNNLTFLDEFIMCSALAAIVTLNWFVIAKVLHPVQKLYIVSSQFMSSDADSKNSLENIKDNIQKQANVIHEAVTVTARLRAGDLETPVENPDSIQLLNELEQLRKDLNALQTQEKERTWVSNGIAKFVDILKADKQSNEKFFQVLISNIVRYLNANQGALFLVSDNDQNTDKHLLLTSCYAYERHKQLTRRIDIGNGMIGQAYLEKDTVLLRNVPDKYISITSGLGEATASNVLIVPMKVNGEVECILEIASFHEFKKFEIEFLEKLGESIASAVASMRVNEHTRKLLHETQSATEQLRAQEEELRQNMEELTATQEEMGRKEKELSRLLDQSVHDQAELNKKLGEIEMLKEKNQRDAARMLQQQERYKADIIEMLNQIPAKIFLKDNKGNMVLCNKTVAEGYGLPVEKVIGTHDRDHFDLSQVTEWEKQEREIMTLGKKTFVQEERFHDKLRFLKTTKLPFEIGHLGERGIMGFQFDVTDTIGAERLEKELREEIARLQRKGALV